MLFRTPAILPWLSCVRLRDIFLQDAGHAPMPHSGARYGLGLFGYRIYEGASQPNGLAAYVE